MHKATAQDFEEAFRRGFPDRTLHMSAGERAFLTFIEVARALGVGFGWMRQAVGFAWQATEPRGFIDDSVLETVVRDDERASVVRHLCAAHDGAAHPSWRYALNAVADQIERGEHRR